MWAGIIGGITGFIGGIAGVLSLWDRIRNRKPSLKLFAPYYYTGTDVGNTCRCLNVLFRLSNSSDKAAFLYLETMGIEVLSDSQWHRVSRVDFAKGQVPVTDFQKSERVRFGVEDVPFLSRFDCILVSRDSPLSGYVCVKSSDPSILVSPKAIRVTVRDCHLHAHVLTVDFDKQQRYDPARPV